MHIITPGELTEKLRGKWNNVNFNSISVGVMAFPLSSRDSGPKVLYASTHSLKHRQRWRCFRKAKIVAIHEVPLQKLSAAAEYRKPTQYF